MTPIKQTRSVCPECLRVLPAEVYEETGEVWITKTCAEHGVSRGRIERDARFYRLTMNAAPVEFARPLRIMVPITHRCNLNCAFCYVPTRDRMDLSIADVEARIAGLPPFYLCLTGGEPTLHPELFAMIDRLRRRPNVLNVGPVTNALKLADPQYVRDLEGCGLNWVLFSFNGLSDDVYRQTNNQPLLAIKQQAFDNLRQSKLITAISPILVRGLNDSHLDGLLDLMVDAGRPFFQLRVRSAAQVGTYRATEALCTSELLDLLARSFGRTKEFFLSGFDPTACYHSPYQFNLALDIERRDGRKHLQSWGYGFHTKPGVKNPLPAWQGHRILVDLWGWPDRYNIDLDDIQSTGVKHLTHTGEVLEFYEAIVRAGEL
jgi:pyruvate-formate lyase-activating enzyme